MANNTTLNTMSGGDVVRDIDRSGVKTQVVQLDHGGASGESLTSSSNPLPVSAASLPLPTGAATAAKQPAPGTAGSPSADVLTVQGATSMTAIKVDGSAVTQPVSKIQQTVTDCVITNGASLSAAVDLGVYRLVGIALPSTFEPTTLSFQASYDGTTYNNVYDATGVEKTLTVAPSRRVILSPADFFGIRYIKVRGGTAASPTTVAADRTLKLVAEA